MPLPCIGCCPLQQTWRFQCACTCCRFVDFQSNTDNCGSCGAYCASGNCTAGTCIDPPPIPGKTYCGQRYVDLDSDYSSCGACYRYCPGVCANGTCINYQLCSNSYVNLQTDKYNCGGCGVYCSTGCKNGTCASVPLPPGFDYCYGQAVDLMSNNRNCGTCGSYCPAPSACTAGYCPGVPGKTLCFLRLVS
jgi:hypothetical protein